MTTPNPTLAPPSYTPEVTHYGKDHWSTLAYIETVLEREVVFRRETNPRMRTCLRCADQLRPGERDVLVRPSDGYPTKLKGLIEIRYHCDWDCVRDLIDSGFLEEHTIDPDLITLTEKGDAAVAALRKHKRSGGTFATFEWNGETS